jgi:hypothetical protein
MTPKEKAKQLVKKYEIQFLSFGDYLPTIKANQCALILVSELIKENLRYDYIPFEGSRTAFYLEVEKILLRYERST